MSALTKKIGQREVLKDIWLSFYPGAKIGVLGRNGSGKSTLLRIMAGIDKNFDGEAKLTEGFTVGLLDAGAAAQSGQGRLRQRRGSRRRRRGHCSPSSSSSPKSSAR